MEEFPGLLARDFGFRPQGKAAPMAASKGAGAGGGLGLGSGIGSGGEMSSATSKGRSSWNSSSFVDDHGGIFGSIGTQKTKDRGYNDGDVFGGPPKYASAAEGRNGAHSGSSFDYDSIFKDSSGKASSSPVFDKPVYDDDNGGGGSFNGVPAAGLKSSTSAKYSDVLSIDSSFKQGERYDDLLGKLGRMDPELKSSSSRKRSGEVPKLDDSYDELLGNLGKVGTESKSSSWIGRRSREVDRDMSGFDDLIPGFGRRSPNDRVPSEASQPHLSTVPSSKSTSTVIEDPFVVFESKSAAPYASSGQFTASVEEIDKPSKSGSTKVDVSSASVIYDNMDPLAGLMKSVPSVSSDMKNREKDRSPSRTTQNLTNLRKNAGRGSTDTPTGRMTENNSQKKTPVVDYHESHQTLFGIPPVSSDSHKAFSRNGSLPSYVNVNTNQSTSQVDVPPKSDRCSESANEVWITVAEVPLFTQPTSAPPPSRPPPARPAKGPKASKGSFSAANSKKVDEFSSFQNPSQSLQRAKTVPHSSRNSGVSSIEELEDFAMGRSQNNVGEVGDVSSEEEVDTNSAAASAAAMKDAMDRAEAKFKCAREVREREIAKVARTRGAAQQEKDEKVMQDARERELREEQERIDREEEQRKREEKEREQRRAREIERERERARQAVERATREARERAAAEARLKAERAAAEKANAARERAERAAVQRAHAEARERAAAEAKERAQRAAAEARERVQAETREKAAAAAKAEAEEHLREDRAAATRVNQQKNDTDIESFFNMGARPNSAPRSRTSSDPAFDVQFHNRPGPEGTYRSSTGTSSSIKKASSATNIVDDLTSIFGASPSSGEFQEVEVESEERRRARLMRHQKAEERAAKALAEKNERDLQAQWEQSERHRMAETVDIEIKRWAAGKEGNLRALLSTLQYVLWPESGWQPVSLTDLITGASVKKVYRKATLCIHPDKVQQKGANLQQKCIAEKVFDLLKEAWNKFNSEELF